LIKNLLESNQYVISICIFPQLGASHKFSAPDHRTIDGSTTTLPNELGCPLTRYQLLRNNISTRRLGRPETRLPIFRDEKTQLPFHDKSASADANTEEFIPTETQENNVYLEGMNLGLGSCSLQVTFQAQNEFEARWLHDQLIPLGPVMLALSAATPVWKGLLVDSDGRWQRFADCADDRTAEEMDELPQRWTYNRTYISQDKPPGLDNECERCLRPEGRQIKNQLIDGGMDEPLAVHFASILSRDPLFLTRDDIHNMDEKRTNIFDLLYSGTWPTVRLKPPMDDAGPGWRVEFRPIEIQLWDSDNAAFAIFMYLVSRAITVFHLNFYLPIAKVGDSMERSQKRDAVTKEKMWFRRAGWSSELCEKFVKDTATTPSQASSSTTRNGFELQPVKAEGYALMTLNEIINGENMSVTEPFPGLIAIVQAYLKHAGFTPSERALLQPYLDLIAQRATGENPTPARWIRSFVAGHEDYRKDSYVSEEICYDIMRRILELDA
jgi:glutamate--cysteine ligase catalytic subunit